MLKGVEESRRMLKRVLIVAATDAEADALRSIAGSYRDNIVVGDVVAPVSDCFADAGMETEGGFITLSEAGMGDPLIKDGRIIADNRYVSLLAGLLKSVKAVTVNTAAGSAETIQKMSKKFNPEIEKKEGT